MSKTSTSWFTIVDQGAYIAPLASHRIVCKQPATAMTVGGYFVDIYGYAVGAAGSHCFQVNVTADSVLTWDDVFQSAFGASLPDSVVGVVVSSDQPFCVVPTSVAATAADLRKSPAYAASTRHCIGRVAG